MLSADFVIATGIAYVGLLFLIAYVSDRRARRGKQSFLRSPFVYTLAISVYCTSWTFYGAVGSAARNGLEYLAIYLGPTLVFIGWWFVLRRLVRISHNQRITSIADLLSSRFGKSSRLAVLVTVIAVIAISPYIALQLKAVTSSIQAIAGARDFGQGSLAGIDDVGLALGVAAGMALFTILFGTRNVDAKEQHHGVVAAIAFEAIVKLAALIAVGVFVVFAGGGFEAIFSRAEAAGLDIYSSENFDSRWIAMNVLSVAAIICLPRQFQITVVENSDENHLRTAGWAFPTYLLLMSLFTLPIALYGLTRMPAGSNPDMFVLTLPLAADQQGLALFAFIGGFSSATSMIIVESIALSIMVSNHIVMPLVLRFTQGQGVGGGVSELLLNSRRFSIALILGLGFFYFYLTRDSDALAPIGLISFCGVAQFLPAIIAALFWKEANVRAATGGVAIGFVIWAWSSFMPSFESSSPLVAAIMAEGPWGIGWLRPEALFGLDGVDPLVNAVFWSLFLNTATLVVASLLSSQSSLERVQATLFADLFHRNGRTTGAAIIRGSATSDDLFFVAKRVLGEERAKALFATAAEEAGVIRSGPEPTPQFIDRLERELAGSIGAASAHVMLSKVVSGDAVSLEEVFEIAGETQQVIEYSQKLERTSTELRSTAQQLEEANQRLRELDSQKDEFLSQVSHEVRTPMTSIRSFSEILLEEGRLKPEERQRFVTTIHTESLRLTKLLDEILDLSALERGERTWENVPIDAEAALDRALEVCTALASQRSMRVVVGTRAPRALVAGDADRLCQVLINLVSNAIKYNDAAAPVVEIRSSAARRRYVIEIADNGPGIAKADRKFIFEKFARGEQGATSVPPGVGLGLAISREIITRMNGKLELVNTGEPGACFRVTLPLPDARTLAAAGTADGA
mgnify:CR=1 FL=1